MVKQHHNQINQKSKHSDNPNRIASKVKGNGGNLRDKGTINRLRMYRNGNPIRNKKGNVIGGTLMMGNRAGDVPIGEIARIAPDRRWFGNTHVIAQDELDRYREEMKIKSSDPYSVLLKRKKLPMSLLKESSQVAEMNLIETESYESTFGAKQTRLKPKIDSSVSDYASLMSNVMRKTEDFDKKQEEIESSKDTSSSFMLDNNADLKHPLFDKGQSKRIWGELYKVIDSSDVIMMVIDARNVPGF